MLFRVRTAKEHMLPNRALSALHLCMHAALVCVTALTAPKALVCARGRQQQPRCRVRHSLRSSFRRAPFSAGHKRQQQQLVVCAAALLWSLCTCLLCVRTPAALHTSSWVPPAKMCAQQCDDTRASAPFATSTQEACPAAAATARLLGAWSCCCVCSEPEHRTHHPAVSARIGCWRPTTAAGTPSTTANSQRVALPPARTALQRAAPEPGSARCSLARCPQEAWTRKAQQV